MRQAADSAILTDAASTNGTAEAIGIDGMAAKAKTSKAKAPSPAPDGAGGCVVLVGTYKGDQLTSWPGWYNWPISDKDEIGETEASRITELWLFQGTKEQRNYKEGFVSFKICKEQERNHIYPRTIEFYRENSPR